MIQLGFIYKGLPYVYETPLSFKKAEEIIKDKLSINVYEYEDN